MNPEEKELLRQALLNVRDNANLRNPLSGICDAVARLLFVDNYVQVHANAYKGLKKLMAEWPEGTGHYLYPVPHPNYNGYEYASEIYGACTDCWNQETTYGVSRWALLHWLIKQLEK